MQPSCLLLVIAGYICHRYCGVKIELDHIKPRADGGEDDIDNAIAVCFECHAEIYLYNDRHPWQEIPPR